MESPKAHTWRASSSERSAAAVGTRRSHRRLGRCESGLLRCSPTAPPRGALHYCVALREGSQLLGQPRGNGAVQKSR